MTNLITEARELCELRRKQKHIPMTMLDKTLELCDALEKAQAEIEKMKPFYKIADDTFRHWENAAYAMRDDERKKHRWIPVTERLPTGRGYYLSVVERIAPDELGGNNTRVKIMRWLGTDWRYPTHIPKWINEAITETVTHWMPLPAPPEEGAEHERDCKA